MQDRRILLISGRKQAGKSTLANYIQATVFKNEGIIGDFSLNSEGKVTGDLRKLDFDKIPCYYEKYCKQYSFAEPFKKILVEVMGLRTEQCYGSNSDKDTLTKYRWENVPGLYETEYKDRTGYMTGREMMMVWGTEIFRKAYDRIWSEYTFRKINEDKVNFAVVNDCRHPTEIDLAEENRAKIIRLMRDPFPNERHDSEVALNPNRFDWKRFHLIVNNRYISQEETFSVVKKSLTEWCWL